MVLDLVVPGYPMEMSVPDNKFILVAEKKLRKGGMYLQKESAVAGSVRKPLTSWADHFIVVNDMTLDQLELVAFVGDKDALEAALWSEVVIIAHAMQELEEAVGRVHLLQREYGAV